MVSMFLFKDKNLRGIDVVPEGGAPTAEQQGDALEARCAHVAETCGFTPRESEDPRAFGAGAHGACDLRRSWSYRRTR